MIFQTEVVVRAQDNAVANWLTIEIDDGPPSTITVPGTNIEDVRQIVSNFVGEDCVFPAARIVVDALCAKYDSRQRRFDFENQNPSSATLVGHSLGGAAVQYIAHSRPDTETEQESEGRQCSEITAYAFGSIGMQQLPDGGNSSFRGNLETYVSDCDWLAQFLFAKKVQTGHITSISPSNSHGIDGIQSDICGCISGNHNILKREASYNLSQNLDICLNRPRQQPTP